ncbi:MAG TPA: hypothetical protein VIK02_07400 [Candidatus Anoxymicrobiaceae bacterium]
MGAETMGAKNVVKYREFSVRGKTFRIPAGDYYFNNQDCWARIDGSRARVGVADSVQQNAGALIAFDPPRIGLEYSIFDEICSLSARNTTIEITSPVTGKLVAVNRDLIDAPGLMNEDPYERGWALELELSDIADDIELLLGCEQYYNIAKAKLEQGPRACPCTRQGALYRRPDSSV